MDPATSFQVASAAVAICFSIGDSIQRLKTLKERLDISTQTIDLLVRRLFVIRHCLGSLHFATNIKNRSRYSRELEDALNVSLEGCETILHCLDLQVEKYQTHERGFGGLLQRSRYVWNENSLKEYLSNLDNEIRALQLVLDCHQL